MYGKSRSKLPRHRSSSATWISAYSGARSMQGKVVPSGHPRSPYLATRVPRTGFLHLAHKSLDGSPGSTSGLNAKRALDSWASWSPCPSSSSGRCICDGRATPEGRIHLHWIAPLEMMARSPEVYRWNSLKSSMARLSRLVKALALSIDLNRRRRVQRSRRPRRCSRHLHLKPPLPEFSFVVLSFESRPQIRRNGAPCGPERS